MALKAFRSLLRRLPYFRLLARPNSPFLYYAGYGEVRLSQQCKPLRITLGPNGSLATVVYLAGNRMAAVVFWRETGCPTAYNNSKQQQQQNDISTGKSEGP